jgi:hypothetical protein
VVNATIRLLNPHRKDGIASKYGKVRPVVSVTRFCANKNPFRLVLPTFGQILRSLDLGNPSAVSSRGTEFAWKFHQSLSSISIDYMV